ncbi:F-box/LRR-repeat protein At3g59200-like [Lotus japonicus]|uniref:F-box/LRR-repeat protein At3g59200-like n=1 Tax=Lotus japonicus TaxID=34305 RepID=UPI0025894AC4|nr:F-box/LRR-repeat protein At3g59200-like [Lotus japonicus]
MLIHILTFLPTKSAFTTSILSKRWTSLCHSLTTLNFDDEGAENQDAISRFTRMVDRFLPSPPIVQLHHQPLQTFCLTSRAKPFNKFEVDNWAEAAKRRGVKNLHLSIYCALLSPRFFTSQTLIVLKLSGCFHIAKYGHKFESVDLPSLKTLHLLEDTCIGVRDNFMKVLSGCPNLVDLYAPS